MYILENKAIKVDFKRDKILFTIKPSRFSFLWGGDLIG